MRCFLGLYLAIFFYSVSALLYVVSHLISRRRKPRNISTWALLSLLSALFVITTVNFVVDIVIAVQLVRGGLIDNPQLPLLPRLQLAEQQVTVPVYLQGWFGNSAGPGFRVV